MDGIHDRLKEKAFELWGRDNLLTEKIVITARALSATEAIGNPEDEDYPIQKGKEKIMQAEFKNSFGQAFTDHFGNFEGSLKDILAMPLKNNFQRAVFIAALNAVLRYQERIDRTIHCRDDEPVACAERLAGYIQEKYGDVKIAQIGFQPRMLEKLSSVFPVRLVDLDPDNVGQRKHGIMIEGPEATEAAVQWCDLLLVTGTTVVNGTIGMFLGRKDVIFYGTTIAGPAKLMGWERFCCEST